MSEGMLNYHCRTISGLNPLRMIAAPFIAEAFFAAICFAMILAPNCAALSFTGVNLAGAEFGATVLPGTYNTNYTYPTSAEVDYFMVKGMNTFRLPFRWERLQQSANGAFNTTELSRLNTFVNYATSHGAYVILDPHNFARYYPDPNHLEDDPARAIGTTAVPNSAFANFWTGVANQYKSNNHVIFGLMNEPNSMTTEQWRDGAQAAITAIRNTGATNLILVPGNAWTGASSWSDNWYGTPNAQVMLSITDPGSNFAFEAHQYLDSNGSGGGSDVVSATVGRDRLTSFTNWLHTNNRRAFLGEFAVPNATIDTVHNGAQIGDDAIDNMLKYVEANRDVWMGWTWWAAGPWWGEYQLTLEPTNLGQPNQADRAAMALLRSHLALAGDYDGNGTVDAADYVVWRKTMSRNVTVGTGADGSGNGLVDQADLNLWRQNLGRARPSYYTSGAGAGVPEPSGILIAFIAVISVINAARAARGRTRRAFN
jgi:endoglucanase